MVNLKELREAADGVFFKDLNHRLMSAAADEIATLRAQVTELEAEGGILLANNSALRAQVEGLEKERERECVWTRTHPGFHWTCLTKHEEADGYSENWDSDREPYFCPKCGGKVRVE